MLYTVSIRQIIITGATSSIAAALCDLHLSFNDEIHAIIHTKSKRIDEFKAKYPQVSIYLIDQENYSDIKNSEVQKLLTNVSNAQTFYHFAWDGVISNNRNDLDTQLSNIQGTINAIKLFKALQYNTNNTKQISQIHLPRFIFAGSQIESIAYSNIAEQVDNLYGISKNTAAKFAKAFANENNIQFIHTLIFSAYGLNDNTHTLLKYIIPRFKKNETVELTPCEQLFEWLHFKDVALCYKLLSEHPDVSNGVIFNVGSGDSKPLKEWVLEIRNLCNSKSDVIFGARENDANNTPVDMRADITEISKLGFKQTVSFKEGMSEIIASY